MKIYKLLTVEVLLFLFRPIFWTEQSYLCLRICASTKSQLTGFKVVAKIFYNEILIKMKNFDLNGFGVQEMNAEEMRETDGGFIPLVIIAVAVVMSSCIQVNVNSDIWIAMQIPGQVLLAVIWGLMKSSSDIRK